MTFPLSFTAGIAIACTQIINLYANPKLSNGRITIIYYNQLADLKAKREVRLIVFIGTAKSKYFSTDRLFELC